ncbi:MAG: helix-turn-helix transcriptional regulator [Pseudohongiella sp.]|nr:helix-turn-helix transcriptional regulator [Pseudohongiella sp.]MDP1757312.1 helix-turn-helix transcriptional regulator [Pseudohongiella sp.]MDP2283249.1 helix-turn-helix transcriptional regulator [Pseudohongiella sp.]
MSALDAGQREAYLREQLGLALTGQISEGELLKRLRKALTGMNQAEFAGLAKISRRSLSDLENDRGVATTALVNAAFSVFGLRLALLPMNADLTKVVCADFQVHDNLPVRIKRFKSTIF